MAHLAKHLSSFGAGDLFQILRDGRPRTRSELAAQTGYARSTIASRIDELLASGLIAPVADAVSTGGRPSARVALNAQTRLVAAADFGATHATVAVMDLAGQVLAEEASLRSIDSGPDGSLAWLADAVRTLLKRVARGSSDLLAIGIGLPGPVEHATGRPTSPPIMPGWDGYDVPTRVKEAFDVPVLVDNDVNVMAFGEQSTGWPGVLNLMFVKVATGIGAGIISGGILQRGESGSAGDIGHIPVPGAEAVICRCGNRGCLEAVAGVPAIVARLATEGLEVSTAAELVALGRTGHLRVMEVIREAGRDIGQVLIACVSIVNPSVIVVGGSLSKANELLIAGMREVVYSRSTPLATRNLTIASSRVGAQAGVIGAGMMAIEHALSPEVISPAD